ncbi:MAG: discoidin domain-containing protein [Solitalea-like symbiont of Tyrophagus putrescentiae]
MQYSLLKIFSLVSLTLGITLYGCKKDFDQEAGRGSDRQAGKIKVEIPTDNFTSEKPYNLNIIYFVPTDKVVNPDYENRISEILLNFHDFVGKWMNHWGYTGKNFGMLTAPAKNAYNKKVKIIVLHGKYASSHYPYNNGGSRIIPEVNEFFKAYPKEKTSEHTLVISPENFDVTKPGTPAPGVPFYGMNGNWAFVLDFKNMSLGYNCSKENLPGNGWIGGFLHELGHGLDLPHVGETKSELSKYGVALMGSGNATYCNSSTFMTKATCAILSNNQLFADKKGEFYKDDKILIDGLMFKRHAVKNNITAVIRISAGDGLDKVLFYFIPSKHSEYYAPSVVSSFVVQNKNKNSLQHTFPNIADYNNGANTINNYAIPIKNTFKGAENNDKYKYVSFAYFDTYDFGEANDTYNMYVRVLFKNGTVRSNYYYNVFKLENGIIDKIKPVVPVDTHNFLIESVEADSEESDGPLSYLTDGLIETKWHSKYRPKIAPYPHFVNFTFKKGIKIKSIYLAQGNRPPKRYELYNIVNNDGKEQFIKIKEGSLGQYLNQVILLDRSINTKKLQIRFLDSHDGEPYASLKEVWFSDQ